MSREQYQIPTGSSQAFGTPDSGSGAGKPFEPAGAVGGSGENVQMKYMCGDCGVRMTLRRADAIRCKECGCRVLYKERTKRMVQFEAR